MAAAAAAEGEGEQKRNGFSLNLKLVSNFNQTSTYVCVFFGEGGGVLPDPATHACIFLISRIGWVYCGGGIGGGRSQGAINGPRKYISYVIIVYRSSFIGKFILKNPASQIDFKYIEKTSKNFKKKSYPFGRRVCVYHFLN